MVKMGVLKLLRFNYFLPAGAWGTGGTCGGTAGGTGGIGIGGKNDRLALSFIPPHAKNIV